MRERVRLAVSAHQPVEMTLDGRVPAAVMVLLQEREGAESLLFHVRTHSVRHHRGEIGFPGGRQDPGDPTLLHTALRETEEEIGVPAGAVKVLGQLDDTATRASNYLVRPFVGVIAPGVDVFAAAPREVHELLPVPLAHLLEHDTFGWYPVEQDGSPVATPAYRYGEYVIWGATARVLSGFLGLLDPAHPGSQLVEAS